MRVLVAIALALSLCACNAVLPLPTSPTTTPPSGPAPPTPGVGPRLVDGSIAGLVFEITPEGPRPVTDVELYCDACGKDGHSYAYSDADGRYAFTGGVWITPGGRPTLLRVHKGGYGDPESTPRSANTPSGTGWREVLIDGDTIFDIELVRR
jgi:hypothetical protein